MSTTTYTSTNARPCPDCGLRRCPPACGSLGLLTSILPASAILTGEIPPPGSLNYTITYVDGRPEVDTQPIVALSDIPDYVTMTGLLNALSEGPQSHAKRRYPGGWYMAACMALILVGAVLVAIGWVFTDETVQFVWSMLPGK